MRNRFEQHRQIDRGIDEQQRTRILALATDFPRLWNDPQTPDRERKRMARLLIEDVTLLKADNVTPYPLPAGREAPPSSPDDVFSAARHS